MQFNDTFEKTKAQFVALNTKAVEFAEENTKAAFAFTREVLPPRPQKPSGRSSSLSSSPSRKPLCKQTEAMSKFYADWLKETSGPSG